ncbi:MAG: AarF/ABC1/UbiB kinase family protein [Actinobacteria bacterium]|nr:AarF/ABC1/UbiB kinase family protein [Actinomycetota bacterium]
MANDRRKDPLPTGLVQRSARLAGQTGKSAARFVGTRMKAFASPDRAQEYLDDFHEQTAEQLVDMLGNMKGAAMKVGQLASFYELAGPDETMSTYREKLTMLQSSAPAMEPEASRKVIEDEFGRPVEAVFADFEEEPVAAASIGQVHRARLLSGETVAVKVQYPGVDQAIRSDLKNLSAMMKVSVAMAPNLDPKEVANEVRDRVLEELDYRREARNQQRFSELYEGHPFVVVPKVFPEYCRRRVITQEFIVGRPFQEAMGWSQAKKDQLAEIFFRFFYGSFNRFNIFSADPHPGNYLLLERGKVAFLDYGLVREVDAQSLHLLHEIVFALIDDDRDRCRRALEGIGILNPRTPEIDAIWEHLKTINILVLENKPLTVDPTLVQSMTAAGVDPRSSAFQTLRKVGVPGVVVTLNRMSFGVVSLLGRLEATANWQAMARELWLGDPSDTELGKREERWLARFHPELAESLAMRRRTAS